MTCLLIPSLLLHLCHVALALCRWMQPSRVAPTTYSGFTPGPNDAATSYYARAVSTAASSSPSSSACPSAAHSSFSTSFPTSPGSVLFFSPSYSHSRSIPAFSSQPSPQPSTDMLQQLRQQIGAELSTLLDPIRQACPGPCFSPSTPTGSRSASTFAEDTEDTNRCCSIEQKASASQATKTSTCACETSRSVPHPLSLGPIFPWQVDAAQSSSILS